MKYFHAHSAPIRTDRDSQQPSPQHASIKAAGSVHRPQSYTHYTIKTQELSTTQRRSLAVP